MNRPFPIQPAPFGTDLEVRQRQIARGQDTLVRAVAAEVMQALSPTGAKDYLARRPDDEATAILHRANASPGTIGGSGWASQLATSATLVFLTGLGGLSAASQLFNLALNIPFDSGQTEASVAGTIVGAAGAFVKEADPIPVIGFDITAAQLEHKKLALITAITREVARSSRGEAEIRRLLNEAAAATLDANLFSENTATDAAPTGLFNGVTATPAAGLDSNPMVDDFATLASVLAPIGGNQIAYVTSPARAVQVAMRAPDFRYPVFASSAVPDTRLAAVAVNALAFGVEPVPDISVAGEAILHMSTTPAEIVNDAGTAADPVRSLYQTDALAIRLNLNIDYAMRAPGGVAIRDGLAW